MTWNDTKYTEEQLEEFVLDGISDTASINYAVDGDAYLDAWISRAYWDPEKADREFVKAAFEYSLAAFIPK